KTGECSFPFPGNKTSEVFDASISGPGLGDTRVCGGALAFQLNPATQTIKQGFQIGTLPVLNALLLQNSPRLLAADRLFGELALQEDAAPDDIWNTSISHEDGNGLIPFSGHRELGSLPLNLSHGIGRQTKGVQP